jgi:hypothetical protein
MHECNHIVICRSVVQKVASHVQCLFIPLHTGTILDYVLFYTKLYGFIFLNL